jgi:anti-anti-sigma factor
MFDLEKRGSTTIVHVRGDVDVLTSESFRETLLAGERDAARIVISMLDCHYLDSTGLTVLISAQRRLGERLAVVIPHGGNVAKIIEIASLGQFLRIVSSLDDATRAVAG